MLCLRYEAGQQGVVVQGALLVQCSTVVQFEMKRLGIVHLLYYWNPFAVTETLVSFSIDFCVFCHSVTELGHSSPSLKLQSKQLH